jgi:hypothetical protein
MFGLIGETPVSIMHRLTGTGIFGGAHGCAAADSSTWKARGRLEGVESHVEGGGMARRGCTRDSEMYRGEEDRRLKCE